MIFKCEVCDNWKDGEGTEVCLKCTKYKHVGRENFSLELEYYQSYEDIASPGDLESLYPTARKHDIWHSINQLDWREATMLTQYYFLEMTQADIAEYHGVQQYQVHRIMAKSIEKIKKL